MGSMGRPIAKIPDESIEPALAYLRSAAARNSTIFVEQHGVVRGEISALNLARAKHPAAEGPALVNAWVDENLTREGRARMLTALRRRRADAKSTRAGTHCTLRLPGKTVRALRSLARQAGMPLAQLLASFAARVQADASVLEHLRQPSAAQNFDQ